MTIKHQTRILISVSFQSKEVKSVYDDCSQISKWFILLYCFFFSLLLPSPFHEESSTLYSLFWIIFTLHLLIIWTLTWVLIPSTTFPSSLWVAVVKVALFKRLPHINAASKVAIMHLMRWCQPSLRYFRVFFLLPCPWSTFLSLNLLGRSL